MQALLSFFSKTAAPVLLIFFVKLLDVVLSDIRLSFLIKGKRKIVFVFSFLEVLVYVYSLSFVLADIKNPTKLFAYALSYALGSILSIEIEKKMAIGTLTFLIVPSLDNSSEMVEDLKNKGFGITILTGKGIEDNSKEVLFITTDRKNGSVLRNAIEDLAPGSFITIIDAKKAVNGKI